MQPRNRRSVTRDFLLILCTCLISAFSPAQESEATNHPIVVGYFLGGGIQKRFFLKNLIMQGAMDTLDQINYSQGHVVNARCTIADPSSDLNYTFSAEESVDGSADTPQLHLRGNFHQLQELKRLHPDLKILISLEGEAEPFAEAAQPANRAAFVSSCIQKFIQGKFADGVEAAGIFDGIDLDWEYPKNADRLNFIALLGEFRRQLNAAGPDLLLTVAMGDNRDTYSHLDLAAVALYTDEVGVMNYDYAGPWSKRTGLVAPLYTTPGDLSKAGDVAATIQDYEDRGVPASKILMGLPFYAYSWTDVSESNNGLFQLGEPSHADLSYRDVVSVKDDFTEYRDPNSLAPWLFDGETFWTYDDEISIAKKLEYAKGESLGGVMIWELSGDTPEGTLLNTISEKYKDDSDENSNPAGDSD